MRENVCVTVGRVRACMRARALVCVCVCVRACERACVCTGIVPNELPYVDMPVLR